MEKIIEHGSPMCYYELMDSGENASLRIALLQISPFKRCEDNLRKGLSACRTAQSSGADIALFPEMWSNGYRIHDRTFSKWRDDAVGEDDSFVDGFRNAASRMEMAIGLTFLKKGERGVENSFLLIDRFGNDVLSYSKVHTCDFSSERFLTIGDDFHVCTLDTKHGNVQIGAMICYDREFPESARILMLKGAEVILVPNACPMEINRLSQLRARSYENMVAIATCNYPSSVAGCNGCSSVFDGIAYSPGEDSSRDMCILMTGEGEGIYTADINLSLLREYRASEVHGNAYRHPEKYKMIIDESVCEPFIRSDSRRR